jgi:hypothetical protein
MSNWILFTLGVNLTKTKIREQNADKYLFSFKNLTWDNIGSRWEIYISSFCFGDL